MSTKVRRTMLVYAVWIPRQANHRPCCEIHFRKGDALRLAREYRGEVRTLPRASWNEGNRPRRGEFGGWDSPTLYVTSDPFADFREGRNL